MKTIYSIGGIFKPKCEDLSIIGNKLVNLGNYLDTKNKWSLEYLTSPSFSLMANKPIKNGMNCFGGDYFEISSRETNEAVSSTKSTSFQKRISEVSNENLDKKIKGLTFEEFTSLLATSPNILPDYIFVNNKINYNRGSGLFEEHYGLVSYQNRLDLKLTNEKNQELHFYMKPKRFPKREFYLPSDIGAPWIIKQQYKIDNDIGIKAAILVNGFGREEIKNMKKVIYDKNRN